MRSRRAPGVSRGVPTENAPTSENPLNSLRYKNGVNGKTSTGVNDTPAHTGGLPRSSQSDFKLTNPRIARIAEMIQNRTTIRDSGT